MSQQQWGHGYNQGQKNGFNKGQAQGQAEGAIAAVIVAGLAWLGKKIFDDSQKQRK